MQIVPGRFLFAPSVRVVFTWADFHPIAVIVLWVMLLAFL